MTQPSKPSDGPVQTAILEALSEGRMTTADLAHRTGRTLDSIRHALMRLKIDGRVKVNQEDWPYDWRLR